MDRVVTSVRGRSVGQKLNVLSYNIHHGEGMQRDSPDFTGFADLEQIAKIIRDTGADIVALQEVDRWHPRSGGVDQPAILADLLSMHVSFGCNVTWSDGGEYGVATLSRFPILSRANTPLPCENGLEQRGVLETSIDVPGIGEVLVLNTHLQYVGEEHEPVAKDERYRQSCVIAAMVAEHAGPVVLMGDFNAEPDDEELAPLVTLIDAWSAAGKGESGLTFPGHPLLELEKRIDLVFVNEVFEVDSARVVRAGDAQFGSDHLPFLAKLVIR